MLQLFVKSSVSFVLLLPLTEGALCAAEQLADQVSSCLSLLQGKVCFDQHWQEKKNTTVNGNVSFSQLYLQEFIFVLLDEQVFRVHLGVWCFIRLLVVWSRGPCISFLPNCLLNASQVSCCRDELPAFWSCCCSEKSLRNKGPAAEGGSHFICPSGWSLQVPADDECSLLVAVLCNEN